MNDYSIYKVCAYALRAFVEKVGEYVSGITTEPASGSVAAGELSSFSDAQLVQTAFGQGTMLAAVVPDHVEAVLRSIDEPVLTVAPWSCTRSTLEAAALAFWFLDPDIGAQERVARSFAFRYQGMMQQAKLSRAANDAGTLQKVLEKIDRLEQDAQLLGYSPITNKKGKRDGVGVRMPTITDLVDGVLGRGSSYRLLSALVHGQPWALQQLSFSLVLDDQGSREVTQSRGVDLFSMKKALSGPSIRFLCLECGDVLGQIETSRCRLFGADAVPIGILLDEFLGQMQSTCTTT